MGNNNNNNNINNNNLNDDDFEQLSVKQQIVGTCETLEKEFVRLQHGVAPDPSQVRPERVLKVALKVLVRKWRL